MSTRPAHGALYGAGAKRKLEVVEDPSWSRWRWRSEAARSRRFIESVLVVPTGAGAGDRFRLAGFERDIVEMVYGNLATFTSLPVGNGKTTLLGAIALERISRGDDYAEVDVIATKRGQAEEVVMAAMRMVESTPELAERCALYADAYELRYRPTGSRLRAQPARLRTLEGLNFNLGIIDEVGFADDDHIESLLARLGKRPDAHLLGIGTPGFEPNMLFRLREDSFDDALPPGVVYREWAAPAGCDLMDRRAWRLANPAMAAGFLNPEALELQAGLMPEWKFRVYHLGQWVERAVGWLPAGAWNALPMVPAPPDGAEIVVAVEGTYKRSLAVVAASLDGSVFMVWAADAATDEELRRVLEVVVDRWTVLEITHSHRIRTRLFSELKREGMPLVPWPSDADTQASSANEFHRAITESLVAHDHDELLADHIDALGVRWMVDGSLRLERPQDGRSADAGMAARAAWWRALKLSDADLSGALAIY